ncbi:type II toxin-antitoxin system RelE/ParE family toxin [Smaragdicoccus niigatensis]|uniref:type II toxin-antitoxin system RelE/ParE family toxin n=1 Tax=Smaragdicoccus niigatensis TaxID=359359 RepID=UPI000766F598|nr:type II toxin-antitoxin system RelE/ParE family toxin [Smaragdicoccus niigatensis]
MSNYVLSPAAQADLEGIWEYTAQQWSLDQAEQYVRLLQRVIERAAAAPGIGRRCDEIRSGYFKLAAGAHVFFYRIANDGVMDVVRILHQRMDVDRSL